MKDRHRDGLPALVEDLLESYAGEWLSAERIIGEIDRLRPGVDPVSVRRAIFRVAQAPRISVERRLTDQGRAVAELELRCAWAGLLEPSGGLMQEGEHTNADTTK